MTDSTADTTFDVLFVGLPATGKTTYLALLFRAIVMEKAGTLRLGGYKDDREYVNEIAETLASCSIAVHTQVDQQQKLALSLTTGTRDVYLTIPDMSGESWEHTLSDRGWTSDMDRRVSDAAGFVVFVHCGRIDTQPTIAETQAGASALGGDNEAPDTGAAATTEGERSVDATDVVRERATQVCVVDLLQLLTSRHHRPVRVSLVLSAWDLVSEGETPSRWVSENLPLVQQFVETNTDWLELKVWGVSAQGGDFENPKSREQLLPQDTVDRSLTRSAEGQNCAVEDPIIWTLRHR